MQERPHMYISTQGLPSWKHGWKKLGFIEKVFWVFRFYVLIYEDRTQNYDPEINEEYLIHDTPIPLPHHIA